ncbi:MAG: class I tRNA ligase family protein, partial [Candidatus Aenigmarchaeota archaeon]|nr:class I tRNA ligase family protein [Candidatus Aenigmarchaeota archaeon]
MDAEDFPKKYNSKETEEKYIKYWQENKIYKFDKKDTKKKIYSIDTPPPTVSGKMHLGHSFSYSQTDMIARYKRMKGFNVFYPFGTDDNGLATIMLIEKTKKIRANKMERGEFIELCLKTLEELRPQYVQDWKRIGLSADFDLFYTTINEHCRKISQESFIDLYKSGRIKRKNSPIMICPKCRTAIAQVELEDAEKDSFLSHIKVQIIGTKEHLVFA